MAMDLEEPTVPSKGCLHFQRHSRADKVVPPLQRPLPVLHAIRLQGHELSQNEKLPKNACQGLLRRKLIRLALDEFPPPRHDLDRRTIGLGRVPSDRIEYLG